MKTLANAKFKETDEERKVKPQKKLSSCSRVTICFE